MRYSATMKTKFSLTRSAATGAATPRPRWLVVDDTEGVLELMATLLERFGAAEICRAHSGPEALELFAGAPEAFTFVVTDFEMPGMNGAELCRQLHALSPRLPILLATGSAELSAEVAQELGFCGLLFKPFPLEDLSRAVADAGVLGEPRRESAAKSSNHEAALAA